VPPRSDPDQRRRLLDAALRRLEESGPEVLRARELTAEVGTSTQALYTLFGGMPGLFETIVAEAFGRFAGHVDAVPEGDDTVADFFAKGWAFSEWALAHPQLYRLMFGLTGGGLRQHAGLELAVAGTVNRSPEAQRAQDVLVSSISRVIDSGRIRPVDPFVAAGQFLSASHGYLLLEIAGVFSAEDRVTVHAAMGVNLMVGLGDSPEAARASMRTVEAAKALAADAAGS
jgi:AcrR family transcriptional regulator